MTGYADDHLGPLNEVAAQINAGRFFEAGLLLDQAEADPEYRDLLFKLAPVVTILRERIRTQNRASYRGTGEDDTSGMDEYRAAKAEIRITAENWSRD